MDLVDLHMLTNILSTTPTHPHPTTTNPTAVWFVPSEGYVRIRATGKLKKGSLKHTNPQLLQM